MASQPRVPDIVILGYAALQRDHGLLLAAAKARGLAAEVWLPESTQVVVGPLGASVLRRGAPVCPRLVLPRGVNRVWTYAEQVLTLWKASGAAVVNSVSSSAACADKLATLTRLSLAGVPVMPAMGVSPGPGVDVADSPSPLVVKPAFGSGGVGVQLFETSREAQRELDSRPLPTGAWRVEHAIVGPVATGAGRDYRVVVAGGTAVACTERTAPRGTFVTNGASASVQPFSDRAIEELAVRASVALGVDFAGVDIILHGPDDQPVVLEVNAWPGLALTSSVCGVNLAEALLEQALKALPPAPLDLARG